MTQILIGHCLTDETKGPIEQVSEQRQVVEMFDVELAFISALLLQDRFSAVNYEHLPGLKPHQVLVKHVTKPDLVEWSPVAHDADFDLLASALGHAGPALHGKDERRYQLREILAAKLGPAVPFPKLVQVES